MQLYPTSVACILLSIYSVMIVQGKTIPRIAIIGAGIGGTSAAYFLEELFSGKADIDVFESGKVGGRLATLKIGNEEYEVGGSIIHPRNKYMVNFVKALGLSKRHGSSDKIGLYDGKEFVFKEGNSDILNYARLFWRYGLDPIRLQSFISNMLSDFERIYALQAQGEAFETVADLLHAMSPHFVNVTRVSTFEGFKKDGFSDRTINELVMATLRANYGQTTEVHKFVGSVSVAGAGGNLWSVHGGNKQVPEGLLHASTAKLHNVEVRRITRTESGKFSLDHVPQTRQDGDSAVNDSQNEDGSTYDIVIIAAPLTKDKSKLEFAGFQKVFKFPGKFHRTVCTIVSGLLNYTSFGFEDENDALNAILTVKDGIFFNSVGTIRPVDYDGTDRKQRNMWKVFSPSELSTQELDNLFSKQEYMHVIDWLAYPQYLSNTNLGSFVLSKNLYYVNAIEWAASAMEMSAIGAKNVALLAHESWHGKDTKRSYHDEL